MFGFLVMMSGMLALATAVFYWISWDMQPRDERRSFTRTVYSDLVDLIAKWRRADSRPGQSRSATPEQVSNSATQQAELPVALTSPALSQS